MRARYIAFTGALMCGSAVVMDALAAHALRPYMSIQSLNSLETAIRIQLAHSIFITAIGWFVLLSGHNYWYRLVNCLVVMLVGTTLFSGSIYFLVFTGFRLFALLTPVGGLILIVSWFWVAGLSFYSNSLSILRKK